MARRPALRLIVPLVVAMAALALAGRSAQAQPRTATVVGRVHDTLGVALSDVSVGIVGSGIRVRTDDSGAFRIVGIVAGPALLTARRLGYRPYSQPLRLQAGDVSEVDVRLGSAPPRPPQPLAEIRVSEPREVWESRLAGFNARSKQQVGHFVTRERIDRANSTRLTDMLREIPGVKIGPVRSEGRSVRLRGALCAPLVFVDGFPATAGEFDLDIIDLKSVEGIEVYSGMAAIPPELSGPREMDRCGVIAVWSRPSRPRQQDAGSAEGAEAGYFTSDQVDDRARLDSGSLDPLYPDSLLHARVAGVVVVEFQVDTMGQVDPATVEVLSSPDDLFTAAVREALEVAHFSPARRKGRRVRQLVQLPVSFALGGSPP